MGIVSPVGIGKEAYWDSLIHGRSGITPIEYFDTSDMPVRHAGIVKNFNPLDYMEEMRVMMYGRSTQYAVAAVKMAVQDAKIEPKQYHKSRLSLIGGTSSPSTDSVEGHLRTAVEQGPWSAPPYSLVSIAIHTACSEASQTLDMFDSSFTISTTCASGSNAIGAGLREIRDGRKDIVVAGSSEHNLSKLVFASYILLGLIVPDDGVPAEKMMRPFDKTRNGGLIAEGAAFVVLEELEHARARGAHIYGELAGHSYKEKYIGEKTTKQTMMNAVTGALINARLQPRDIDYICANGNSTIVQDKAETAVLKEVFGDYAYRIPVSAIKSMIGIPNSAVGPMQLIAACLSFENDIVPPTINYEVPDPECDLDYVPNVARVNRVNAALINNYALGGACAAIIAKRFVPNGK